MMKRCIANFGQLGLLLLILLLSSGCTLNAFERAEEEQPQEAALTPSPEFSPDQVVRLQLEALQRNDETNQGIQITFNFASPDNKKFTGPLPRFIKMLKSPLYRPMLNHKSVEFDPIEISGDTAVQRVKLIGADGQAVIYIFSLSRQTEPPYENCWMTDGVIGEPVKELPEQGA
jgi:hypothetical protein